MKASVSYTYSRRKKQLPEKIARAIYDKLARLHFSQQLFLWEV